MNWTVCWEMWSIYNLLTSPRIEQAVPRRAGFAAVTLWGAHWRSRMLWIRAQLLALRSLYVYVYNMYVCIYILYVCIGFPDGSGVKNPLPSRREKSESVSCSVTSNSLRPQDLSMGFCNAWRIPWTEDPGRLHTVHVVAKSWTWLSTQKKVGGGEEQMELADLNIPKLHIII